MAEECNSFTGADLAALCREAALSALLEGVSLDSVQGTEVRGPALPALINRCFPLSKLSVAAPGPLNLWGVRSVTLTQEIPEVSEEHFDRARRKVVRRFRKEQRAPQQPTTSMHRRIHSLSNVRLPKLDTHSLARPPAATAGGLPRPRTRDGPARGLLGGHRRA